MQEEIIFGVGTLGMAEATWASWPQEQEALCRHQALLEDITASEVMSKVRILMGALTSNMWALMHKAAVMDIAPPQRSVLPALTLNVVQGSATVLGMLGTKISLFDFRTQIPQKEL